MSPNENRRGEVVGVQKMETPFFTQKKQPETGVRIPYDRIIMLFAMSAPSLCAHKNTSLLY